MTTCCILCEREVNGDTLLCSDCFGEGQVLSADSPHRVAANK